jgi:hypothetical protein
MEGIVLLAGIAHRNSMASVTRLVATRFTIKDFGRALYFNHT